MQANVSAYGSNNGNQGIQNDTTKAMNYRLHIYNTFSNGDKVSTLNGMEWRKIVRMNVFSTVITSIIFIILEGVVVANENAI